MKSKCKFKVGDIVKGIDPDRYYWTNTHMTKAEVIDVDGDEYVGFDADMTLKVLEHEDGWMVAQEFDVNSKYFALVDDSPSITITRSDDKVIAKNDTTGEKGTARCHPDDEFDFNIGAKIAFNRLLGEEVCDKKDEPKEVKFLEKFEEGTTYVFDKETYCKKYLGEQLPLWVDDCDGKVVDVQTPTLGLIDSGCFLPYAISPSWCKEVKDEVEVEPTVPEEPKYYNGKVVCTKGFSGLTTKGKIYEFVDGYLTYDDGNKSCDVVHSFEDVCKCFVSKFIEVVE